MKKVWRVIVAIVMVYAAVMVVMSVQCFFDRGDLRKAVRVIYEYKPPSHPDKTLLELMASGLKLNPDHLHCETELLSRYEGRVLVECGEAGNNYQWVVDVVRSTVQSKNQNAEKLTKQ